ncbi:MAG: hypothetical protein HRU14_04675 [Planctomycetes bacterium]|nr:hypothetical protein [Planctomycetota bacterium]
MREMSRRSAIGSVAASLLAGGALGSAGGQAPPAGGVKEMTLEEFKAMEGSEAASGLFSGMRPGSFTRCHKRMRVEQGIWIPELVPVFAKLDGLLGNDRG